MNITHKTGSPYKPSTQGGVERLNRTLIEKLRKLTVDQSNYWECNVEEAVAAYNHSKHRATGMSPNEVFGIELFTEIDKKYNMKKLVSSKRKIKRNEKIEKIRESFSRYQTSYEKLKNQSNEMYLLGEIVWYSDPGKSGRSKLDPKFDVKGKIIERNFESFVVELEDGRIIRGSSRHFKRVGNVSSN